MENQGGALGFYERLSQRERRLLVAWATTMGLLGTFLVGWFIWGTISEKQEKFEQNQEVLQLIARKQNEYLQRKNGGGSGDDSKKIEEKIATNELKLQTYLDREAGRFNLKIKNFKESSLVVGGKKGKKTEGSALLEESVAIDIEEAPFKDVARFLDALKSSRELIIIKRIDIDRPRRNSRAKSNPDEDQPQAPVKTSLTVSTFKKESS